MQPGALVRVGLELFGCSLIVWRLGVLASLGAVEGQRQCGAWLCMMGCCIDEGGSRSLYWQVLQGEFWVGSSPGGSAVVDFNDLYPEE